MAKRKHKINLDTIEPNMDYVFAYTKMFEQNYPTAELRQKRIGELRVRLTWLEKEFPNVLQRRKAKEDILSKITALQRI